jgi:signal transduction histidine kinase
MTRSRQKSKAVNSPISELSSLSSSSVSSSSTPSLPILDGPSRTIVSTDSGSIHPESTLEDLPLHRCIVELSVTGAELAVLFQRSPQVPGAVILNADGSLVGVVIRSVFFELMLDGSGNPSPFLQQTLQIFWRYVCSPVLKLSGDSGILVSAKRALRRISKAIGEPILVNVSGEYLLLDFHTLNIAYWQIRGIETQVAYERIQIQMIRNDKMASLGRLVNGVSHEILDPVSFIWGNLSHLSRYIKDVMQVLDRY